jgi:F-type H+-transporting ATPase subunit gamma
MKSVGNIQKITAAMKMVAASRLKGAQTRMEKSRGFIGPLFRLLGDQPGNYMHQSDCACTFHLSKIPFEQGNMFKQQ